MEAMSQEDPFRTANQYAFGHLSRPVAEFSSFYTGSRMRDLFLLYTFRTMVLESPCIQTVSEARAMKADSMHFSYSIPSRVSFIPPQED